MEKLIGLVFVGVTLGIVVCGNATWILIAANLLWLLVKGTVLVSWWWPIGTGIYALVAAGAIFWLKIST